MRQATDSVVVDDKRAWALRGRLGRGGERGARRVPVAGKIQKIEWLGTPHKARPDAMPAHHHAQGLGSSVSRESMAHGRQKRSRSQQCFHVFSRYANAPRGSNTRREREREMEKPEPASPIDPRTSSSYQRPIYYTTMSAQRPQTRPSRRPLSISASPSPKTCSDSKPPSTSLWLLAARQTDDPKAQS